MCGTEELFYAERRNKFRIHVVITLSMGSHPLVGNTWENAKYDDIEN